MTVNLKQLMEDLERDEGRVNHAYQDHLGYWTIGIGHLIDKNKGGGLSDKMVDAIFLEDIDNVIQELGNAFPWFHELPEPAARGLCNMAFQLGLPNLSHFVKMLTALHARDWKQAAHEALHSKWAMQTPERAQRVAALYLECV